MLRGCFTLALWGTAVTAGLILYLGFGNGTGLLLILALSLLVAFGNRPRKKL